MITKHDCSLYHAKQILNLTLTGIVNESSDQLGILYEYDANATHPAELANLAYDVLKAVPVLSTYHNSPTGNAPRIADRLVKKSMGELLAGIDWWNLKDWIDTIKEMWARLMSWFESLIEAFLDLLSDLVAFVMDAVQKVAEALGSLVQAVAEAGLTLVKAVAAAAMEALENLLKAALLAMIWLSFALSSLVFLAFMGLFHLILNGLNPILQSLNLSAPETENASQSQDSKHSKGKNTAQTSLNMNIKMEREYGHNQFFDIDYPIIGLIFNSGVFQFKGFSSFFGFHSEMNSNINMTALLTNETIINKTINNATIVEKQAQLSPTEIFFLKMVSTMGTTMSITGGVASILAGILLVTPKDRWTFGFISGIITYGVSLFLWLVVITKAFSEPPHPAIFIGMGFGFLICGVLFRVVYKYLKGHVDVDLVHGRYMAKYKGWFSLGKEVSFIDLIGKIGKAFRGKSILFRLTTLLLEFKNEDPPKWAITNVILSLISGIISMFGAGSSIILFTGQNIKYKKKMANYFTIATLVLGVIFLTIGGIYFVKEG